MSEQTRSRWTNLPLTVLRITWAPLLLFSTGIVLIITLGLAQRFGWIISGVETSPHSSEPVSAEPGVLYICPMMCTPPLSEPGRCPVCAMELVPSSSGNRSGDHRSIEIDPASRRVANIQTVVARSAPVSRVIRAVGQLSFDEGRLKTLSAYVDGRLDRLYADYTGVVVKQGDDLALLYSPELYTAQTELLAAKRTSERGRSSSFAGVLNSESLYEDTRRRLIDLGITEKQIERLEQTGKPVTRIELVAPIHGTVIEKLASEGEYVKTGQPIYRLADLSVVWLMLELFPEDAAAIRFGQRVEAEVQSRPGQPFVGRVAFVDPVVNAKTRTVGVRVVIANDDGRLTIGDYATARIEVPVTDPSSPETEIYDAELAGKWISPRHPHVIEDGPGPCRLCGIALVPASSLGFSDEPVARQEQIVVPRDAVLMAGSNSVVYVETQPGRFELKPVGLGPSLDDEIVLLSGVEAGEKVATKGNFLLDSQMQLAGNPSLIDSAQRPSPPSSTENAPAPEVVAALARLSEEDRALAKKQRICPVTGAALGSMGTPPKVDVEGRVIFICCEGCRQALLDEPAELLAKLDAANAAAQAEAEIDGSNGLDLLPPIGPITFGDESSLEQPPALPDSATGDPFQAIELEDDPKNGRRGTDQ